MKIDHNTGNYVPYPFRIVFGFFNVPQSYMWIRTHDLPLNRPALFQLSQTGRLECFSILLNCFQDSFNLMVILYSAKITQNVV